jgi:hypothetical protein
VDPRSGRGARPWFGLIWVAPSAARASTHLARGLPQRPYEPGSRSNFYGSPRMSSHTRTGGPGAKPNWLVASYTVGKEVAALQCRVQFGPYVNTRVLYARFRTIRRELREPLRKTRPRRSGALFY